MLNMTALDAALKSHYSASRVRDMVYDNNPWLAIIPKYERFGGKNLPVPIRFADPQNRAAQFQQAQRSVSGGPSSTDSSSFEDFVLTRVKNYSLGFLDAETIEAAQSDMDTFVREATNEIDGVLHTISRDLALDLFLDGNGVRGAIGTVVGTLITLATTADIVNFEVGMLLQSALTATGAVKSATDVPSVTAVDRDAGTITTSADTTAYGTAWAAADFLFAYGDAPNTGAVKKISGLASWLPSTAPGATSFFGVDRSQDTTRLGGVRYDGSAETIEEALIGAAVRLGREGGRPDLVLMNHVHVGELLKTLGSKVVFDRVASSDAAKIGFDAIKLMTPMGAMRIVADLNCPVGVAYMLQTNTWKLYSLKGAPRILSLDGLRMLRQATSDSYEVRAGFYAQTGCDAPGWNARITLPS